MRSRLVPRVAPLTHSVCLAHLAALVRAAVTTRLSFRKGKGSERIAKLIDSPTMPEADAVFEITAAGIQSPE